MAAQAKQGVDCPDGRDRRGEFHQLTRDVLAFGRIRDMDDGLRHFKELNGELVAYSPSQVDTPGSQPFRPTLPLEQVLARDSISRPDCDSFRERLHDVKLIGFEVRPGYVAFLYDGMLDNLEGYLYAVGDQEPPALGSELFTTQLVVLRPLGNGWYWFATT